VGRPTRSRSTTRPSKNAAETFAEIASTRTTSSAARRPIPDIDFRDAPDAIPSGDEPACLMHRQASFIVNFFPEGTEFGSDYGVFPFPEIDGNAGCADRR
jgi:alpha-glucoside transport system substrate-binding protein